MSPRLPITLISVALLVALTAASCGGGSSANGADRAVGDGWDAESAIIRSEIIEQALGYGLARGVTACMLNQLRESVDLERVAGFDLSAKTGSGATAEESELLAAALVACGPSVDAMMHAAAPGSRSVPASHAAEAECFRTAYREGVQASYAERFRSTSGSGSHDVDIVGPMRACEAAGALLLGASEEGHLEASSLNTLEWDCLVGRLPAAAFEPAYPFPDETGDALERLGAGIRDDVAFCEAWVSGTPLEG